MVCGLNQNQGRAGHKPLLCHLLAVWPWVSSFTPLSPPFLTSFSLGCSECYIPSRYLINCRLNKGRSEHVQENGV